MEQIDYFVPDVVAPGTAPVLHDCRIAARLRWPVPAGVTQVYAETYTRPGEIVLGPYCQGLVLVQEVVSANRQALAVNFDPVVLLLLQSCLSPPPARELDAAVARLGDSSKQDVPLRRYLQDYYSTICPACLRPVTADYFVWNREGELVAKYLRCPACGWDGPAGIEPADRERAASVPTQGMHYHYLLDRMTAEHPAAGPRARLESLLGLYSARNLYALAELTLKIESMFSQGPLQCALKTMLLDCLDRCSSLNTPPGASARPRGLARPSRFLERNVWQAFENAAQRLSTSGSSPVTSLAHSLEDWSSEGRRGNCVAPCLVRDLPRVLDPRSIGLILFSPPPLDSAAWSLSYFWGAWLLGAEAVRPLRSLLRQRTPDPSWYGRVMAGALSTLVDLLHDDGRMVVVLSGASTALVEALVLAAASARMGVASLLQCNEDYRLELTPTLPPGGRVAPVSRGLARSAADPGQTPEATPFETQVKRAAVQAGVETIQARGEPVPWRVLHASLLQRLAAVGLLDEAILGGAEGRAPSTLDLVANLVATSLDDSVFVALPAPDGAEPLRWLAAPTGLAAPLADRAEVASHSVLSDALVITEADFARAVYLRLRGPLTPDRLLLAICLRSYGHEATPGHWQLRDEDLAANREAERKTVIEHLGSLGRRLGYRAASLPPWDVAWSMRGQVRAGFAVRVQATMGEVLEMTPGTPEFRPYLVIPGSRSAVVSYKLDHNPVWQRRVDEASWRFIKYRHVRELVAKRDVDEYTLKTVIGLDPIVERDSAQLSLF